MGQQHLGRMQPMFLKTGLIGLHQPHLPNGRGGLQLMDGFRPPAPAHAAHALGHRAGGDQDQLPPIGNPGRHLLHPGRQRFPVQPLAVTGQQGTADLHYPAAGGGNSVT